MDPPPFDQPMIRKCIKTSVRIQNHEALQEVLILTTVLCSVESQLNKSNGPQDSAGGDGMPSGDDDNMSDYSESSDDYSDSGDSEVNDENAQYKSAPQSQDEERYKMKAFWLRKDPICEVCLNLLSCIVLILKFLLTIIKTLSPRIIMEFLARTYIMPKFSEKQICTGYVQTKR